MKNPEDEISKEVYLCIRIPQKLHKHIKVKAINHGVTIKSFIMNLIMNTIEEKNE